MAYDTTWYCNSTGYAAVTPWAASTAVAAGTLRRQLAVPALNNERVFVCIIAGTTGATEPSWNLTRAAKTVDGTVTWIEVTGVSAMNGDQVNTATWMSARMLSSEFMQVGGIIRSNSGASYQICTTAGTMGAGEPTTFSDTAGVTTVDNGVTWTSLGPVGNFINGGAPHARMNNAGAANGAWFAAGNTCYIGDNHAEVQSTANMYFSPPGGGAPNSVGSWICHNHLGHYPPRSSDLTTGATISAVNGYSLILEPSNATYYFYGLIFQGGSGSVNAYIQCLPVDATYIFDNCSFRLTTTYSNAIIYINGASQSGNVIWNNTTVSFGAVGQYLAPYTVIFNWKNTGPILAAGSLVPTNLIGQVSNGYLSYITLEGLDLSQINTSIFWAAGAVQFGTWSIQDCKLNSAATVQTPYFPSQTIQYSRSDGGPASYKSLRSTFEGMETTDISVTRVGSSADPNGQVQSRKIMTTPNVAWLKPYKAEPYAVWNTKAASTVTLTVYGMIIGPLPNNDEVWIDVEYLGSSAFPIGSFLSTTKSNPLAANAPVATDSSAWNNMQPPSSAGYVVFDGTPITNVTLSNNLRTATHTNTTSGSGAQSVVVTSVASKVKCYFEATIGATHGAGDALGVITQGAAYSSLSTGSTGPTVIFADGSTLCQTSNLGKKLGAFGPGDIACTAFDFGREAAWFRKNNGPWNGDPLADPGTGAGAIQCGSAAGILAVAFGGTGSQANDNVTLNTGQAPFAFPVPTGFPPFYTNPPWTPFKLVATLSSPQPGMPGLIYVRPSIARPSATIWLDPSPVLN